MIPWWTTIEVSNENRDGRAEKSGSSALLILLANSLQQIKNKRNISSNQHFKEDYLYVASSANSSARS